MILVDTSVWIDHFREGVHELAERLEANSVLMHPFVLGELACGNLRSRAETLHLLGNLPTAARASDSEVLQFIELNKLMGKGIGFTDAHLLAATTLTGDAKLWTRDKRLSDIARRLKLGYNSSVN